MNKKDESTAINELISLVSTRGPSVKDPGDDLFALPSKKKPVVADMFTISKGKAPRMSTAPAGAAEVAPLPRTRVPIGTQPNSVVPPTPALVRASASDFGSPAALQTPVEIAVDEEHIELEAPAASQPMKKVRAVSVPGKTTDQPWFDDSRVVERPVFENTSKVHAKAVPSPTRALAKKLAVPAVIMIGLGGALGGYLAISSKKSAPSVAPRPAAAPTAAASARDVTVAAPSAPETPKVALVDVRFDSQPAGATVMLVDHGKSSFLGTTPIAASVDPSRTYDVVFTYGAAPPRTEKLDPRAMTKLFVKLAPPPPPPSRVVPSVAQKSVTPVKVEAPAAPIGDGVLMISSKPPCEILVDGEPTGLVTPQRAMSLPAGTHKITLVTPDKTAKKTLTVEITPDKPTKVIQDLLAP